MTKILTTTYTLAFAALIGLAYWLPNLDIISRLALAFIALVGLLILYAYNVFTYLNK